jgi:predicted metal-dependent phosphotriesterase family hydrolase
LIYNEIYNFRGRCFILIQTVLGPVENNNLGFILPHEHIMVGFIEGGRLSNNDYDFNNVIETILPNLNVLKECGCSTFVDCTPQYLGRDAFILKELSIRSGLNIVTNTGFYKEPYLPAFTYDMSVVELAELWIKEALCGIGSSGVLPGFIKIALNEGELIPIQIKILKAAAIASKATGLVIQCHTVGGVAISEAADILEEEKFDFDNFIWVHADTEMDLTYHKKLAAAGMWIEVDSVGYRPYEEHIKLLKELIALGFENKLLISQDTGWYNIGEVNGGSIRPYHKIFTEFIPLALKSGISKEMIDKFFVKNPAKALRIRVK